MTESALEVENIVCHGCYAVLDVDDKFCRHCGRPTGSAVAEPASTQPSQAPSRRWIDSRWFMLLMLFVVFGPLALPALWRSKAFDRQGKIIVTIVLAIACVYVIWRFTILLQPMLDSYQEVFRLMEEMRH